MAKPLLRIDGDVEQPLELAFDDLREFPERDQVQDVSQLNPNRRGGGVTLRSILDRAKPNPSAAYLTLHASTDGFAASVRLEAVQERGILVYRLDGSALPVSAGGPIRFFIRDSAACRTDELDDCANVKFVDRIEITTEPGQDTRYENGAANE